MTMKHEYVWETRGKVEMIKWDLISFDVVQSTRELQIWAACLGANFSHRSCT
jgi:hypothetical protein